MADISSRFSRLLGKFAGKREEAEPKIESPVGLPLPDGLESYLMALADGPDPLDPRRVALYRKVLLSISFDPGPFDERDLDNFCGAPTELPGTLADMVNAAGADHPHWPQATARYRRVWIPEVTTETIVCQLRWEDPTGLMRACLTDWPQTRTALSAALTIGAGLHGVPGFTWRLSAAEPDYTGVMNLLECRLELAQDGDLDSIRWLLLIYRSMQFEAAPRHIQYWSQREAAASASENDTEFFT